MIAITAALLHWPHSFRVKVLFFALSLKQQSDTTNVWRWCLLLFVARQITRSALHWQQKTFRFMSEDGTNHNLVSSRLYHDTKTRFTEGVKLTDGYNERPNLYCKIYPLEWQKHHLSITTLPHDVTTKSHFSNRHVRDVHTTLMTTANFWYTYATLNAPAM